MRLLRRAALLAFMILMPWIVFILGLYFGFIGAGP
jgi:hypothetical protein